MEVKLRCNRCNWRQTTVFLDGFKQTHCPCCEVGAMKEDSADEAKVLVPDGRKRKRSRVRKGR